jgi:hypothetical protein
MISTSQQVGGSIGTALLNTIAASSTATYLATHASNASHKAALVHGFSTAYLWGAGFLVIASAISLIAVNADRPKHEARTAPAGDGSMELVEPAEDQEARQAANPVLDRDHPSRQCTTAPSVAPNRQR